MPADMDPVALPRPVFDSADAPLYERTASRLLGDLRAGGARDGDRLPSERVLAERYEVSRVTLRSALSELERLGAVVSAASRGWFVVDPGSDDATSPPMSPSVLGFADFAASQGLPTRSTVLSAGVRASTVAEARELRIAPGAEIFEMFRLRFLDDLVVVHEHNRLPLALCPAMATTDFERASLYATLRSADPAQIPRVADYSVEARPPSSREQDLLEIDSSVPLLVATQLAYNEQGRPLELTLAAYRGDRYQFRASITSRG